MNRDPKISDGYNTEKKEKQNKNNNKEKIKKRLKIYFLHELTFESSDKQMLFSVS